MSESIKRSIRYCLPESPFLLILISVPLIIFGGYNEFSALSTRFCYAWAIILRAESIFPVAWVENKRTTTPLMDALLVPYNRKQHQMIQILCLSLLFYVPQFLMNVLYVLIHKMTVTETLIVFTNHFSYSIMFLISLIAAQNVINKHTRLILQVFSVFWGMACSCIFTELLIPNVLLIVLTFVLVILGRKENTETKSVSKGVNKNLSGILRLSKMQIIKERPVAESFGYGLSFYWVYRLITRISRILMASFESFTIDDLLNMESLMMILIPVSIITSISAIKRIYISKNMLRVIPVKKGDLFTASTFLALRIPVLIQLISVIIVWIFAGQNDLSLFFASTHPLEIIIHGLFLAVLPTCLYLICFIVHARQDRFVTAFLFGFAVLATAFSYKVFIAATNDVIMGKAVCLAMLIVFPHIFAWTSYRKMQNVHS